jgi:hypothetical protein
MAASSSSTLPLSWKIGNLDQLRLALYLKENLDVAQPDPEAVAYFSRAIAQPETPTNFELTQAINLYEHEHPGSLELTAILRTFEREMADRGGLSLTTRALIASAELVAPVWRLEQYYGYRMTNSLQQLQRSYLDPKEVEYRKRKAIAAIRGPTDEEAAQLRTEPNATPANRSAQFYRGTLGFSYLGGIGNLDGYRYFCWTGGLAYGGHLDILLSRDQARLKIRHIIGQAVRGGQLAVVKHYMPFEVARSNRTLAAKNKPVTGKISGLLARSTYSQAVSEGHFDIFDWINAEYQFPVDPKDLVRWSALGNSLENFRSVLTATFPEPTQRLLQRFISALAGFGSGNIDILLYLLTRLEEPFLAGGFRGVLKYLIRLGPYPVEVFLRELFSRGFIPAAALTRNKLENVIRAVHRLPAEVVADYIAILTRYIPGVDFSPIVAAVPAPPMGAEEEGDSSEEDVAELEG